MFIYHTNQKKIITDLNEAFAAFAKENWRPDFKRTDLVGKSLLSQITDPATKHLYSILLERLRETNQPLTLPYRCDSPDIKRYMEMTITPATDGIVEWNSRILNEEPRPPVPLLDIRQERHEKWLRVCSWCKRCSVPEWLAEQVDSPPAESWIELEELMPLLGGLASAGMPMITHTACPDCYEKVLSSIERG
jgi:hypothetical protein